MDFKNTVIILTTNLGTRDVAKAVSLGFQASEDAESNYERMKQKVNDELKQHFRPEFLNRIDDTIVFHQLTRGRDPRDRGHHDRADRDPAAQQGHGPGADRQRQEVPGEEGLRPGAGCPSAAPHDPARDRGHLSERILFNELQPGPDRGGRLRGRPGRHREVQAGLPRRGEAGRGAGRGPGRPRRRRRPPARTSKHSTHERAAPVAEATGAVAGCALHRAARRTCRGESLDACRAICGRHGGATTPRSARPGVAGQAGRTVRADRLDQAVCDQAGERPGALDVVGPDQVQRWLRHRPGRVPQHRRAAARAPGGRCRRTAAGGGSGRPGAGCAGGPPGADRLAAGRPRSAATRAVQTSAPSSMKAALARAARGRLGGQQLLGGDQVGRPWWPARRRARRPPPGRPAGGRWCRPPGAAGRTRTRRPPGPCTSPTPGQRQQRVQVGGHLAAVPLHDRHRALVQPQRPARVAEPAPHPDRLRRRCPRPARPASASGPASLPGREDPDDRRLLQHDLADQDRPGADARAARHGRSRAFSLVPPDDRVASVGRSSRRR